MNDKWRVFLTGQAAFKRGVDHYDVQASTPREAEKIVEAKCKWHSGQKQGAKGQRENVPCPVDKSRTTLIVDQVTRYAE